MTKATQKENAWVGAMDYISLKSGLSQTRPGVSIIVLLPG